MNKKQQPTPKIVTRTLTIEGTTWQGVGASEAEAFQNMKVISGEPKTEKAA